MANGKFSINVSAWCKQTGLSGALVMRKLGLDSYRGVLLRSPVNTGRFRASNRISLNSRDLTVEPERIGKSKDGKGSAPSAFENGKGTVVALKAKWGDTVHITNSLPYAVPLENGSSAQTNHRPDGIFGATFQEQAANLDRAVKKARAAAKNGGGIE